MNKDFLLLQSSALFFIRFCSSFDSLQKLSAVFVWYCSLIAFAETVLLFICNRKLSLESRFRFSIVLANT